VTAERPGDGCSEAAAIPDRVAALRDALETRPLDDANAHRQRAEDSEDVTDRIDALEDALATYQRAADLIDADDSPFEGNAAAAREDAEAVIEDLVAALLDAGAEAETAAEWMQEADNQRSAYELSTEARDHYERARELAESYPPGDVAAIEADIRDVADEIDLLEIQIELGSVNQDLE